MHENLFKHISRYIHLTNEDRKILSSHLIKKSIRSKDILCKLGDRCNEIYFVDKGCLHMFFTSENGVDRTIQFAIENWWITDFMAFSSNGKSGFTIQAVEDSTISVLTFSSRNILMEKLPIMEKYFRMVYEKSYGASICKTKYHFNYSKEEIYFHFIEKFPEFAQRVPQYLIASYLGLTPEYLSKIRARNVS